MVRHTLNVSIKSKGYQLAVCFHHLPTEGSTCAYPSEATAFRDLFMHLFCVRMCTTYVFRYPRRPEETSHPLELKLQKLFN